MDQPRASENERATTLPDRTNGSVLCARRAGPFRILLKQYDRDFRQAAHAHDLGTIDFTLAGGGVGRCGREKIESLPGRTEFFAPGREHDFASGPRGIRTLHVAFEPGVQASLATGRPARDDVLGVDGAAAAGIAARMTREVTDPDASSMLACESLAYELLGVATRWKDRPETGARWLTWVREYLHAGNSGALTELGALAGVHPSHLARSFAAQYGVSPGEYHRRVRLGHVAERLAGNPQPLARLACEAGFADQAHLTRWFKRTAGLTPGAYARVMQAHADATRQ